jgi:hypothetical protein
MKKALNYLKRNKWYVVLIVILLVLAIWCYSIIDFWDYIVIAYWNNKQGQHIELATLFILIFTFLAIVWYTIETKRLRIETGKLRDVSNKALKLNYSTLIDGRIYNILEKKDDCIKFAKGNILIHKGENIIKMFLEDLKSKYILLPIENYSINSDKENCHKLFSNLLGTKYDVLRRYSILIIDFIGMIVKTKNSGLDWDTLYYSTHFNLFFDDYEIIFLFYLGITNESIAKSIEELDFIKYNVKKALLLDKRHINFYNSVMEFHKEIEKIKRGLQTNEYSL